MNENAQAPLVLIVDDDADGRAMYAVSLQAAGFRVEEAADGFEAVDKAYKLRPSAVLMDLLMPRLDGWDVIGWLKKNAVTGEIPIVAVTGGTEEHRQKAAQAGCATVLLKPCEPNRVIAELRRILEPVARPAAR